MSIHKRIQAFTVSEMVVVLIITSIVVGLAFSVLNLVQKHMMGIQQNFNKKATFQKLEQVLYLDFNRYPDIEFDAFEEKLTFKSDIDSTTYWFKENGIIKEPDTFNILWHNKDLFFKGSKVSNGNIDALKLTASKENKHRTLFIFKTNDATHFINHGI
ncbi:hypothetical protein [Seonamhaeicola sp.]|uniref:PulJ/GspJ family protein n=1 Tax=Seonamhaeicola sp. TaxID=1912245 RepID=UPI002604850A|nr:hypothetical protein [Seonamhaeicola sp.]